MSEDDEELQKEIMIAEMARRKAKAKVDELRALADARKLKKETEERIQRLEQSRGAVERPEPSTSSASPASEDSQEFSKSVPRMMKMSMPTKEKLKELATLFSGMGWMFIIIGVGLLALKFILGLEFLFTYFQFFAVGIVFLIVGTFVDRLIEPKAEPQKRRRE
jgi:hypothetical protein